MQCITRNSDISSFLSPQEFSEEIIYIFSQFLVFEKSGEYTLLYNTLTSELISLSDPEFQLIDSKRPSKYKDSNLIRSLVAHHYLVPVDLDEMQLYKELYDFSKILKNNGGITRYNILTTTGCNLRCYYCFEQGVNASNMSADVAEEIISYITKTHAPHKKIHLRWFGGEPLVNSKVIDIICSGLTKNGIDFFSTMSSNGVLFSSEILEKVQDWKLKHVRISLDGFGKEHDIRKGFATDGNIFESVIKNIDMIADRNIEVNVRLTIDSKSIDNMEKLATWLIDRYRSYKNVTIYNRCVFEEFSSKSYHASPISVSKIFKKIQQLDNLLLKNGMYDMSRIAPVGFQTYYCAASDPHAIVIDPKGRLCGCESINNETRYWGNIWDGVTDEEYRRTWHDCEIRLKCKECAFLPVCTPFDKCSIDFFDCRLKLEYIHKLYINNMFCLGNK